MEPSQESNTLTHQTQYFHTSMGQILNKFYQKSHIGTQKKNVQRHCISKMRLKTLQQQKLVTHLGHHTTTMTQVDVHHLEH